MLSDLYDRDKKVAGVFPSDIQSSRLYFDQNKIWLALAHRGKRQYDIKVFDVVDWEYQKEFTNVEAFSFHQGLAFFPKRTEEGYVTKVYDAQDYQLRFTRDEYLYSKQVVAKGDILYFYDIDHGIFRYDSTTDTDTQLLDWSSTFPEDIYFYDFWISEEQDRLYFIDTNKNYYYFKISADH
ncbi:MAG: hypothetical protein U9Q15_00080 [Patescibacteria group bacterium]|nr:hypothetical protein [Patescibacteria group bacterium]